jgi:hypothetical protein
VLTLVVLSILAGCVFLPSSNAIAFFTRNRSATIEVNGALVQGEMLNGRLPALVTSGITCSSAEGFGDMKPTHLDILLEALYFHLECLEKNGASNSCKGHWIC